MRSERVAARRVARWVLLACTILGLTAMHSLGHGGSHGEHPGGPLGPAAVMAEPMTALAAAPAAVAAGGCDGGCHPAGGPVRHRDDMPVFSVCLAVLAAFGIAVLLARLLLTTSGRPRPRGSAAARWVASRAPPRPGAGLRLAAVSVLRR